MDCQQVQEEILDSLAEPRTLEPDVDAHLAGCQACRSFSETQVMLDLRLGAAISAPAMSAAFRGTLMNRVGREPISVWPGFLPDLAHGLGCVLATALCLASLPFPAGVVVLAGFGFALTTYFFQTVLQGSLEDREEDTLS